MPAAPADTATPTRRVDPTLNPITRRPGPGRGRPRKSQPGGEGGGSVGSESADNSTMTPLDPNMSVSPGATAGPALAHDPAMQSQAMETEEDGAGGGGLDQQRQQQAAVEDEQALAASAGGGGPYPVSSARALHQAADEQHPSKRQRIDSDAMDHETALDDEAVLALAAHNGTTPADYAE